MSKQDKDKEKVLLICQDCGAEFELSYGRYRRLPIDNHWRCKTCTNIKRSLIFVNLTDDERKQLKEQRSSASKRVWESLNADELMRRSKSQRERWARLSPEEKEQIMLKTREGNKRYQNLTETKLKLARRNIDRWKKLSVDDRLRELQRLNKIREDYWNNLTDHEKYIKMEKLWNSQVHIGPTEYIFNDKLHEIGLINGEHYFWGYSTYPFIHQDYYNVFGKINAVTGEENYPYHTWDFIIYPKSDNPILIDIDGSVHNPKNMRFQRLSNLYTEREKIDYNDSQRYYQIPDGMNAYIIEAYYDKLEPKTRIRDINNKKIIKYDDILKLISDRFPPENISDDVVVKSSSTIDQL